MRKVFYKAVFSIEECRGVGFVYKKFYCIRETDYVAWCLDEKSFTLLSARKRNQKDGESDYHFCKRDNIKLKKIYKQCGRFAFDTKEKAFKHLLMLKRKQLIHLRVDAAWISKFITLFGDVDFSALKENKFSNVVYLSDLEKLIGKVKEKRKVNIKHCNNKFKSGDSVSCENLYPGRTLCFIAYSDRLRYSTDAICILDGMPVGVNSFDLEFKE